MRYATQRTDYLLELVRMLRRYEGQKDDGRFIEALLRAVENPEGRRRPATSALYHPVDLVA